METNGLRPLPKTKFPLVRPMIIGRFLILVILSFLTSCLNQFSLEVTSKESSLQFELPLTYGFIPLTSMNNYPVKGKCSNLTTLTLKVDGMDATVSCTNGRFQANYDFSAKSDGNISIEASGVNEKKEVITQTKVIVKDTTPPSAALVISGLGSSFSADPLPRSITISTTQDDFYYKTKLINSGTCAGVDFSAVTASPLAFFPLSLTANQNNTLCVLSADRVGNWRTTPISSTQVYLDTVSPQLSFSTSSVGAATNSSITVNWTLTELNPDSAQNMTLEYSPTGGAPWTVLDQRTVGSTSLSSAPYNYSWTTPGTGANGKLRLTYTDRVGNIGSGLIDAYVDGGNPILDTILIADGNAVVGVPTVKVNLTTTTSISPVTHVRFSENAAFTGASWVSYDNGERFFTVTPTSGPKTIYAQVRSATGQTSNVLSGNVTLDFGNPPNMKILSPLAGTSYGPGQTVSISWECSTTSIVGLAAVPIPAISYSVDDGVSYHNIAVNRTNNDSATTGSLTWTIPSTTPSGQTVSSSKPLRIMGYCSAASGVVSSGMSDLLNSEWRVLAGEPGNLEEGIHLSLANLNTTSGFFGDSKNNLYYAHKHAIMKIDSKSGLVSTWLGNMELAACTLGSGFTGSVNLPQLIDMSSGDELLFYSATCERLYKVNTVTKQIVWSRSIMITPYSSVTGEMRLSYVKSGYLYFTEDYALYELDLNSLSSTPRHVAGTPSTCAAAQASDGTAATSSPLICTNRSINMHPTVSPDRKKMWVTSNITGTNTAYFEWDDLTNQYVSRANTIGPLSRCHQADFDSVGLYCLRVTPGNILKDISYLNTATLTFSAAHSLATYKNLIGQTFIGVGRNSIYSFTNSNELFENVYDTASGTFTTNMIGGKAFHIFGEADTGGGTDISKIAFTAIADFVWDPVSSNFFVRGAQHIRRLHLNTVGTPFIDAIHSASATSIPNSTPMYGMSVSPDGTILANTGTGTGGSSWRTVDPNSWNTTTMTVTNSTSYYVTRTTFSYPNIGDSFVMNGGHAVRANPYMLGTILPNNKLYFMGTSNSLATNDVFLFESDRTTVKNIAGSLGTATYDPTDDGGPALGASFTDVYGMQPVLSAVSSWYQDLLLFDGPRLRRISIQTYVNEPGPPSAPTIHDEIDFATFANYPGNKAWDHAIYDEDTGWSYFAYAADPNLGEVPEVWAARAAEGFVRINTTGIVLNKTGTRSLKLQITPLGLVLLDSNKRRLIYTELFN